MEGGVSYSTERLDHLGIVAGVCREIGLAEWLDEQAGQSERKISIGTATMAMVLNGLGFSNRRLYLVPQFFANKPVEQLLGEGIEADDLNDDCLGRTLDWIYEHDPTKLFAAIARRARGVFGISRKQIHVDTTSFSVSGEYEGGDEAAIEVTYGYSRDHREDLKQWMLSLATTRDGDVPLFMRALDGNTSDKVSLVGTVTALEEQLGTEEEPCIYVADSGLYSEANMRRLGEALVWWVVRVPETSSEAKSVIEPYAPAWQSSIDGQMRWYTRLMDLPQGKERWVVVSTVSGEKRAQQTMERKLEREREKWEKALWHLGNQEFACEADARAALSQATKKLPEWLEVSSTVRSSPRYGKSGRPSKDAIPESVIWQVEGKLGVDQESVEREWRRRAVFIVGTNVLDTAVLSDEAVARTYKEQGGVERGFGFLKDPLFLASSVFVKKPSRIVALGFLMVLCLLVYRLAEHRLRTQLAETKESVPNQVGKQTERPTMRWVFQLFEGIDLLRISSPTGTTLQILGLQPVHQQILRLLGPTHQKIYNPTE